MTEVEENPHQTISHLIALTGARRIYRPCDLSGKEVEQQIEVLTELENGVQCTVWVNREQFHSLVHKYGGR